MSPKSIDREPGELLLDAGFHVAAMMSMAYLNYFVFFPRFLAHRKVGRYILEFAGPFAVLMAITIHIKRFIADGYTHKFGFMYSERFTILMVVNTLFLVLFVAMLKFVEDWLELEDRRKEIEHERLTSELRFLKAQINPHFLFNTLNNLYYLAFIQSPNTPEVIAKLSQMMRYMIYDSNHATVSLQKEIEYMENYIALERLRINNQIPIEFEVKGPVERVQVTPLVLITFLENAFKHGVSNNATDAWVKVALSVEGKRLLYRVENSILAIKDEKTKEPSGIGLQNAQRRLDLSYPNRHHLNVAQEPDRYTVELTLEVN